ncbi:MAG: type II toxin-antitoxin system RelE/ParE family toxin [Ahniella sp.]|nr:type II toxin-antitoxin system RelE/ParE family toxin [Ahniella sp.]
MFTVLTTEAYRAWFAQLRDRVASIRITAKLKRVEQGNLGDAKPVGNGVSELRVDHGPGYRLYFTRRGLEVIILLCGGDKSTQARDIETAHELAARLTHRLNED